MVRALIQFWLFRKAMEAYQQSLVLSFKEYYNDPSPARASSYMTLQACGQVGWFIKREDSDNISNRE